MFSNGPRYDKLKTNLRLSINRMKLLQKKKTEQALKARKEIADYLQAGKVDRARIRVEHIIREDYLVEALEMLEMYCDLLLARFGVIQNMKEIDPALEEPVCTLIWCAPRLFTDVQELKPVAEQLTIKYTKKYVDENCRHDDCCKASTRVRQKLSVAAPPASLVERYLIEIAKTYNVAYEGDQRILAQAEASAAVGSLIDLGGVPAPMNAAQFGMLPGQTACSNADPAMGYPPGAFSGMPPQPPPYTLGPELGFGTEKSDANPTYDLAGSAQPPGWTSYPQQPSAPPAVGPPGYAYGFPPAQPSAGPYGDKSQAPNGAPNAAAAAQPPAANAANAAAIGFVLPDVPDALTPLPDASNTATAGGNSDVDFDELQRRFDELKKKK